MSASGERADVFICVLLLVVCMLSAYITKKYHFIYLPEAACAMILGMLFGSLALIFKVGRDLRFDPQLFFYFLLPLIIFQAGYSLKKKDFFRNFSTITLFAVLGTIISALVYGLCTYLLYEMGIVRHLNPKAPLVEALMFGSLVSAIDPVSTLSVFNDVSAPSLLYNIIFGESLVNDASSIVLFRTFESFKDKEFTFSTILVALGWFFVISVGSILLGMAVSLATALILKFIEIRADNAKFELAFILLSGYVAYAGAELLSLSGIMSLFFSGICNAHYGYYSISHASKISSRYAFETLGFLAEMFVFAWCGMQVVVMRHTYDWGLLLSAVPLCLLSRAANIFPLSWLANLGRTKKIPRSMVLMMWMCGLRGAVAYALAANMPGSHRALETTTLFIVVFTTLVFGGLTGPMLTALGLSTEGSAGDPGVLGRFVRLGAAGEGGGRGGEGPGAEGEDASLADLLSSEAMRRPSGVHRLFKYIDMHYLKPVFGGRDEREFEQLFPLYSGDGQGASAALLDGLDSDDFNDAGFFSSPSGSEADFLRLEPNPVGVGGTGR